MTKGSLLYRGPDPLMVECGRRYAEENGITFVRSAANGYQIIWEGHRSLRKAQEALGKLVTTETE